MSPEPDVRIPFPARYGAPGCPNCGYHCGCCCYCECQTPCPTPCEDGRCNCEAGCHGGHEPWDCHAFVTRYDWAKEKSARLMKEKDMDNEERATLEWLLAEARWQRDGYDQRGHVGWLILQCYNGEWADERCAWLPAEDEARWDLAHWSQAYPDTEWRLARVVLEENS